MTKKKDADIKQDAPGATGVVNENTNSTGPMTPSQPYPEGTPTATQVAPPPTPEDYLREQEKGGQDPVNLAVDPVYAEVLNIPKDQPYPTQDSPAGYLDIPDESLRSQADLRSFGYDESGAEIDRGEIDNAGSVDADRRLAEGRGPGVPGVEPNQPYPTQDDDGLLTQDGTRLRRDL